MRATSIGLDAEVGEIYQKEHVQKEHVIVDRSCDCIRASKITVDIDLSSIS